MSDNVVSFGYTLGYCTTENGSFTDIAQLVDVAIPQQKVAAINITNHDSPDAEEFIPGVVKKNEPLKYTALFTADQYETLQSQFGVKQYWLLSYPDGSTDDWYGFIFELGNNPQDTDKGIQTEFSIQISGAITFTASNNS